MTAKMNRQNNNPSNQVKPDIFLDRDSAAPLTRNEEHASRAILAEEDSEELYDEHAEAAHRKMWLHFQAAASSLTQLYRDRDTLSDRRIPQNRYRDMEGTTTDQSRSNQDSMWVHFQTAAGNLTQLYRESLDNVLRSGGNLAHKAGYQRARKELLTWARSKRRSIPRNELLATLANMNMSAPPEILSSLQTTQLTQNSTSQAQSLLEVEDLLQAATFNDNSHHHNDHMPLSVATSPTSGSGASFGSAATEEVVSLSNHHGHLSTGFPRQGVKRTLPPLFNYSEQDHSQDHHPQDTQSLDDLFTNPVYDCFAVAAALANSTDSEPSDTSNSNDDNHSNYRDGRIEHEFSPVLKKPRT